MKKILWAAVCVLAFSVPVLGESMAPFDMAKADQPSISQAIAEGSASNPVVMTVDLGGQMLSCRPSAGQIADRWYKQLLSTPLLYHPMPQSGTLLAIAVGMIGLVRLGARRKISVVRCRPTRRLYGA